MSQLANSVMESVINIIPLCQGLMILLKMNGLSFFPVNRSDPVLHPLTKSEAKLEYLA